LFAFSGNEIKKKKHRRGTRGRGRKIKKKTGENGVPRLSVLEQMAFD
jgi:hypothetical protein